MSDTPAPAPGAVPESTTEGTIAALELLLAAEKKYHGAVPEVCPRCNGKKWLRIGWNYNDGVSCPDCVKPTVPEVETPRTDAEKISKHLLRTSRHPECAEFVSVHVSRTLERELAALKEEAQQIANHVGVPTLKDAWALLLRGKQQDGEKIAEMFDRIKARSKEVVRLREENERLRAALKGYE